MKIMKKKGMTEESYRMLLMNCPFDIGSEEVFEEELKGWLDWNELKDKDFEEEGFWKRRRHPCLELDLHYCTVSRSIELLRDFVDWSYRREEEVVKVIHGKGNHSIGGYAKVKVAVIEWLEGEGKRYVSNFKRALSKDGGAGATMVWLLRRRVLIQKRGLI